MARWTVYMATKYPEQCQLAIDEKPCGGVPTWRAAFYVVGSLAAGFLVGYGLGHLGL